MSAEAVISVTDLGKDYRRGSNVVRALRSVSLDVTPGEFIAIMGPPGSGKSTFMNLIGCLDRPTTGSYRLDGLEVSDLGPNQLADLRNRKLGFIFQGFLLLPRMTALENVAPPMVYAAVPGKIRGQRAPARRFKNTSRIWMPYSILTGTIIVASFVAAAASSNVTGAPTGLWQRIGIVAGWGWLAILTLRLRSRRPSA